MIEKVIEKIVRRLRWIEREHSREDPSTTKGKHYHSSVLDEHGGIQGPFASALHTTWRPRACAVRVRPRAERTSDSCEPVTLVHSNSRQ